MEIPKNSLFCFLRLICFIIFIHFLSLVIGFDLTCTVTSGKTWEVSLVNHCRVTNLNITASNHKITSVNGKNATNQYEGFYVTSQNVHRIPTEIGSFFSNILSFWVYDSKLKEITKNYLKAFTNLKELVLNSNDLEKLDGNLFEHNRKLQYVSLANNKFKHVGEELLLNLNLIGTFFGNCGCINASSTTSSTTSTIIQTLLNQCPSTKDMKIRMYFEEDFKKIED